MRWAALALAVFLVHAASADGAVTRLHLDWTTDRSDRDQNPYVAVYLNGQRAASYFTRCPCPTEQGVRWEEANVNTGGFAWTISLGDDQREAARRMCFEVTAPPIQTGAMQVSLAVTDAGGGGRTVQFALAASQTSAVECSPVAFSPPTNPAYDPSRPPWLEEAIK